MIKLNTNEHTHTLIIVYAIRPTVFLKQQAYILQIVATISIINETRISAAKKISSCIHKCSDMLN